MNIDSFKKFYSKGSLIPVYREFPLGDKTPESIFLKVNRKYSYLLESVEGEKKLARFSFIGFEPSTVFRSKDNKIFIEKKGKLIKKNSDDPLSELEKIMNKFKPVKIKQLPRFWGGAVGYIGYDAVRFFEKIPDKNPDRLKLPEMFFLFSDALIVIDHIRKKLIIIVYVFCGNGNRESGYYKAEEKIEKIKRMIEVYPVRDNPDTKRRGDGCLWQPISNGVKSNFSKKKFISIVKKAKEYIKAGDVIQVVLSQRFRVKFYGEPFKIYKALRRINPSPYMYYIDFGDLKLIGTSPEILVRKEGEIVETRPIAGTRKRGKNPKEDEVLKRELLNDPKEKAEHIMLVDLGRNDIGRVCKFNSIKISEFMVIEKYSHVMHIVTDVIGTIKKNMDSFDLLRASFPAGTVAGAPKIRAMEIIDELEGEKRGPYAGAVGYFSYTGNMDMAINIRTVVMHKDTAYIQAGAGIVADSVPEREYEETVNKAKGMIKALEMAEGE